MTAADLLARVTLDLRTRRQAALACARWGFAAASVLFFCFYAANLPWGTMRLRIGHYPLDAIFGGTGPRSEVAQAKSLGLTYEAALANPAASVGKPVIWCVDHPTYGVSYAGGKPSQIVLLENDAAMSLNSPTTGGRCDTVLAVVTAVGPDSVTLRFVERR